MAFFKFIFNTFLFVCVSAVIVTFCLLGLSLWFGPKIAPKFIDTWVQGKTGFSMTINNANISLIKGEVTVEGANLRNPAYFQNKGFVDLERAFIRAKLSSLMTKKAHVERAELYFNKITVVRSADGTINGKEFIDSFKASKKEAPAAGSSEPEVVVEAPKEDVVEDKVEKRSEPFIDVPNDVFIESLVISFDNLELVGFPKADSKPKLYAINYSKEFNNIQKIDNVIAQIKEDMKQFGVQIMTDIVLDQPISTVTEKATKEVNRFLKKSLGEGVGGAIGDTLENSVKKAFDTIKSI